MAAAPTAPRMEPPPLLLCPCRVPQTTSKSEWVLGTEWISRVMCECWVLLEFWVLGEAAGLGVTSWLLSPEGA